jgi:hypothetical protein
MGTLFCGVELYRVKVAYIFSSSQARSSEREREKWYRMFSGITLTILSVGVVERLSKLPEACRVSLCL